MGARPRCLAHQELGTTTLRIAVTNGRDRKILADKVGALLSTGPSGVDGVPARQAGADDVSALRGGRVPLLLACALTIVPAAGCGGAAAGTYTIRVLVSDGHGGTSNAEVDITVR